MTCLHPGTNPRNGKKFPCGQCLPCRMNKRNSWNLRLQWEAAGHLSTLFIGLTYADEHVPLTRKGNPTLDPEHFRYWLRMLRRCHKNPIRYYALGEYGTEESRPHYHVHLFGDYPLPYPNCVYSQEQDGIQCMHRCSVDCFVKHIRRLWYYGHATAYPCTPADLAYTTLHHVVGHEPPWPDSHRVFTSMSTHPGIGDNFFKNKRLVKHINDYEIPSHTYTPQGQVTALPRYYRDKIFTEADRVYLGLEVDESPSSLAKSQNFTYEYKKNRWRAKGKL